MPSSLPLSRVRQSRTWAMPLRAPQSRQSTESKQIFRLAYELLCCRRQPDGGPIGISRSRHQRHIAADFHAQVTKERAQ
jgi:hypothetical protein